MADNPLLRFQLDPLAEVLAAMSWGRACGVDASRWRTLQDKATAAGPAAAAFRTALRLVCDAYGRDYGWACRPTLQSSM